MAELSEYSANKLSWLLANQVETAATLKNAQSAYDAAAWQVAEFLRKQIKKAKQPVVEAPIDKVDI